MHKRLKRHVSNSHLNYRLPILLNIRLVIFLIHMMGCQLLGRLKIMYGSLVAMGNYIINFKRCWGILNAPVTGLMISQLIIDGYCDSDLNVDYFCPNRFLG
jgi:hypothetical protein